jgi:hypothetical protein
MPEPSEGSNRSNPPPGMGGLFCLPISAELPALGTGLDPLALPWSPLILTQDLEEDRLADEPNDTLEALALFQPSPVAQGDERRSGNTTDHTTTLGTQATGASDDDSDASPSLTQYETVDDTTQSETEDKGNDGGGGNPGTNARGEGGTVTMRDFEGDKDMARQVLYPCDNQLIAVYGDTIHRNDGRHLDGGIADDKVWQGRYDRVVSHPHPMYNPP